MKKLSILLAMLSVFGAASMNASVSVLDTSLENGKTYTSSNLPQIESGKLIVSDDGYDITFDNVKFVDEVGGTTNFLLINGIYVTITLIGENSISTKCASGIYLNNGNSDFSKTCHYLLKGGSLYIESRVTGIRYHSNLVLDMEDTKYESKSSSKDSSDRYMYNFIDCNNTFGSWNTVGHLNIKNSTVIGHQSVSEFGLKLNQLELIDCMMVEPLGNVQLVRDTEFQYGYHIFCNGAIAADFVIRPTSEVTVINKGSEGDINHDGSVNTGDVSALYQLILNN